jgi:hypothetical protein
LPWQCTSDGTIFVDFVSTVPANAGLPPPPPGMPPMLLTSVSPTGQGQVFRLDQVPELYVSSEQDHYASDSEVVFLVRAARENKPVRQSYTVGSYHGEYTSNAAEQSLYIVSFDRNGEFQRTIEPESSFRIQWIGVFSSGTFLAFGYDEKDRSPRLAMLKQDGTLLKSLEIPKGDAPEKLGTQLGRGWAMSPSELVPEGHAILVVQNKTTYPLLEISQGGAIRAIHPRLPKGERIEYVIPADQNLYVIAGQDDASGHSAEVIYELNAEDGTVLKRFELTEGRTPADGVACVHEGKFLSIDYGDGQVVPLVGTPEPVTTAAQQKPYRPKR